MNEVTEQEFLIKALVAGVDKNVNAQYERTVVMMITKRDIIHALARDLVKFNPLRFDTDGDGKLNLSFTGDHANFKRIVGTLFKHGYTDWPKPDQKQSSYFGWCVGTAGLEIYFSYSSTECKRVQIGTRMVEQPLYDVQCGVPEFEAAPSLEDQVMRQLT